MANCDIILSKAGCASVSRTPDYFIERKQDKVVRSQVPAKRTNTTPTA
jgi:hypothetical protein